MCGEKRGWKNYIKLSASFFYVYAQMKRRRSCTALHKYQIAIC